MTPSDWYLAALEIAGDYGTLAREQIATLGVHEGDAHAGWYRIPEPKRWMLDSPPPPEQYVQIWTQNHEPSATIDGIPADACYAFQAGCRTPISEDRYERAMRGLSRNRLGAFGSPIPASGIAEGATPYRSM